VLNKSMRVVAWSLAVAMIGLFAYALTMGYHDRPLLFFLVVVLRFVAGIGIGFLVGLLSILVLFSLRRSGAVATGISVAAVSGTVCTIGLAIADLVESL